MAGRSRTAPSHGPARSTTSTRPRFQAGGLGYDQRYAWPAFPRVAVDAGATSVDVLTQTARSLATAANVVRAIDAVTAKPETGSTLTVVMTPLNQVATIQTNVPNIYLEQQAFNTVIENDLRLAINDGLDKLILDKIAASGFQAPGTDPLLVSVRKAMTTILAAGYSPDTLILTPAAAEALDLAVSGITGGTQDFVFAPGKLRAEPDLRAQQADLEDDRRRPRSSTRRRSASCTRARCRWPGSRRTRARRTARMCGWSSTACSASSARPPQSGSPPRNGRRARSRRARRRRRARPSPSVRLCLSASAPAPAHVADGDGAKPVTTCPRTPLGATPTLSRTNNALSKREWGEMPAKIVMVNGDNFVVDMDVDRAASDILVGSDKFATLEAQNGSSTKRVYVIRDHIAYAEAYEPSVPSVEAI